MVTMGKAEVGRVRQQRDRPRLLLAGSALFTDGMAPVLREAGMDVLGRAETIASCVEALVQLPVQVVVLFPSGQLLDRETWVRSATAAIRRVDREVRLLVVGRAPGIDGVDGVASADLGVPDFVAVVQALASRSRTTSRPQPARLARRPPESEAEYTLLCLAGLTRREREVLDLMCQGADSELMARELGIARNTVRTHVHNVISKMGVHSRVAAVSRTLRTGESEPAPARA